MFTGVRFGFDAGRDGQGGVLLPEWRLEPDAAPV